MKIGGLAAVLALGATAAFAQGGGNYPVTTMNFDLWCQQDQHLPPDRCDKRTPEDEKTFEAYRAQVEHYEIPYLQEKRGQMSLDRNILHNDPIDNPITQDPQAQQQMPSEQPVKPSP
jgi:hypothetical protein